jgi:hypothetical protein
MSREPSSPIIALASNGGANGKQSTDQQRTEKLGHVHPKTDPDQCQQGDHTGGVRHAFDIVVCRYGKQGPIRKQSREERRGYLREYMRGYRIQHPGLSTQYVREYRKRRREPGQENVSKPR